MRDDFSTPWKQAFKANTTRIGFKLVMTQPMLEMLCALSDDVEWDRTWMHSILIPDNFLATREALARRGLVEFKTDAEKPDKKRDGILLRPYLKLTPAGVAVVEMLRVGGLFIESRIAKDKLAKRGRA